MELDPDEIDRKIIKLTRQLVKSLIRFELDDFKSRFESSAIDSIINFIDGSQIIFQWSDYEIYDICVSFGADILKGKPFQSIHPSVIISVFKKRPNSTDEELLTLSTALHTLALSSSLNKQNKQNDKQNIIDKIFRIFMTKKYPNFKAFEQINNIIPYLLSFYSKKEFTEQELATIYYGIGITNDALISINNVIKMREKKEKKEKNRNKTDVNPILSKLSSHFTNIVKNGINNKDDPLSQAPFIPALPLELKQLEDIQELKDFKKWNRKEIDYYCHLSNDDGFQVLRDYRHTIQTYNANGGNISKEAETFLIKHKTLNDNRKYGDFEEEEDFVVSITARPGLINLCSIADSIFQKVTDKINAANIKIEREDMMEYYGKLLDILYIKIYNRITYFEQSGLDQCDYEFRIMEEIYSFYQSRITQSLPKKRRYRNLPNRKM